MWHSDSEDGNWYSCPTPRQYSTFSQIELVFSECYQTLVTAHLQFEKASVLTMEYPIELLTLHKLVNIIEQGKFVLTQQRYWDYFHLLEYKNATISVCKIKIPTNAFLFLP